MGELVDIIVKVLVVVLVCSVPVWIATRRARRQFRDRFGRTPTDLEMDSLGAWLKDSPPGSTTTPSSPQPPPKTRFGGGPRT
jgi:hypothetical protein